MQSFNVCNCYGIIMYMSEIHTTFRFYSIAIY